MAQKKEKAFMTVVFNTKEEFDKHYDRIYSSGYKTGFKDGRINALGYILDAIDQSFTDEEISDAQYEVRQRKIREWRKKYEAEKKSEAEERKAVEEP